MQEEMEFIEVFSDARDPQYEDPLDKEEQEDKVQNHEPQIDPTLLVLDATPLTEPTDDLLTPMN